MRDSTPIDAIADAHVTGLVELSPTYATYLGVSGHDHLLEDGSPEYHAAVAALNSRTLGALAGVSPQDHQDTITAAAMRDRLGLELDRYEAGDHLRDLNNIASTPQEIRDVFALMPTDTEEQWNNIANRLRAVGDALKGYEATLREGINRGIVPSVRPVVDCIAQAKENASGESAFTSLARRAPDHMEVHLLEAAAQAGAAYAEFGRFLANELAPVAHTADAVGRDLYERGSHEFVGAVVDLDETYEWGVASLREVAAEQEELARRIVGGDASVADAIAALDADPKRRLRGVEALQEWMQETAEEAISALNGKYFEIPERVRTIEACIAPTASGGIYYTSPSEDFSRPGRMWWSIPDGVTEFTTWAEKTTVYHEGVPGHHLQLAQAIHNSDELNRWRRNSFTSGHGEGWALYAERLMEEFGFLDDDGDRFGMLDAQRLRATRVVLDLGVHLGKPAFDDYGGGVWDYEKAWALLRDNVAMEPQMLRFEFHRYLSWPGQAPSYRVGQRIWEQIRADAAKEPGFDLKEFHTRALNLGSLPLDVLRAAIAGSGQWKLTV